ncbi:hypothetical protein ACOACO_17065 [Nocardioides sp. CPCC 205120]|uniref:hypothetical protein n=1 Tax=Nocardioides sp. CPCC 205120 TaxID=3406462 RepID=UPI003B509D1E
MRAQRSISVTVLALALAPLAACGGGSDDDADGGSSSSTTASADASGSASAEPTSSEPPVVVPPESVSTGEPLPGVEGAACPATVTLEGAVSATWEGEGAVSAQGDYGPTATYQTTSPDGYVVTVYAAGEGFDAGVIVDTGAGSFVSTPGEPGLVAQADGTGAEVEAELIQMEVPDETLAVTASFACG